MLSLATSKSKKPSAQPPDPNIRLNFGETAARRSVLAAVGCRMESTSMAFTPQRTAPDELIKRFGATPFPRAIRRIAFCAGSFIGACLNLPSDYRLPNSKEETVYIRKRVLRVGKKICGIHYIRNVQRRNNRKVQYARAQVYRSSVLAQDEKAFYIAPPNRRPRIVTNSRKQLLKLFPHGKKTVTIYFAL
jgi:hypothetical protein